MLRSWIVGAVAVFALALVLDSNVEGVVKDKDIPTVKEIMGGCMKSGLCKKVMSGKGDEDDQKKLFKLLGHLADNKAPEGTDDKNWKALTKGITDAIKTGDTKKVNAALKCAACHKEYKGK
ncbi:MAG: hypothetical protein EXR98_06175 [Gemmataceae bacterium]|nr:hypothetical protein [Gemmataceae bacterium]